MDKWRKNEQARRNIARKWEIVELREFLGISPYQRENPNNLAHRIWERNKDMDWMTPDAVVPFQAAIVDLSETIQLNPDYQALRNGTVSDELIAKTLGNYYAGRKCL